MTNHSDTPASPSSSCASLRPLDTGRPGHNRAAAIRAATIHSATRNGMPEQIARDMADKAVRKYHRGHSAARAMTLAINTQPGATA